MTDVRVLQFLMRAGLVRRYHNRTTILDDTVGRHTFGVLWLVWLLADKMPRATLLLAALKHDVSEAVASDVSSPVKRIPEVRDVLAKIERRVEEAFGIPPYEEALSSHEAQILMVADKLEGMLFCAHEVKGLGNKRLTGVYHRYQEYVKEQIASGHLEPWLAKRADQIRYAINEAYLITEDEEDVCL